MPQFRRVTDAFFVSPQITPADVVVAAAHGFVLIINNRPDGETFDQADSREIADASRSAGLAYIHIPVVGQPTAEQIEAMSRAIRASGGKVLAFCRSGARSITTWALGAPLPRGELIAHAAAAGFDLSRLP